MKSNPAVPGGSLTSKPTWSNTFGCSATSAFFVLGDVRRSQSLRGGSPMEKLDPSVAQQIAQAAIAFQQQRTGHEPKSVAVVLSGDTLLITLHGALSPAEQALAKSPAGAARVQEFHRQLFTNSADSCGRRSKESPGSRCAKRPRKSNRLRAPWCRCSRPAPWCRCSCSPGAYPRAVGAGTDQASHHKKRRFCHVSSIEEESGVGCGRRGRWVSVAC